jgi:hypothetical protein
MADAHVISVETEVDDLKDVPFGRNRFLKWLGGGVLAASVGLATRAIPADAYHGSPPACCFGYGVCHCCNGRYCCNVGTDCHRHSFSLGCPGGEQCWNCCSGGNLYRCCDWHEVGPGYHEPCICAGLIRSC